MTALGLFTGRPPARRQHQEPFTQTRPTTSGGESQQVRYHVVVAGSVMGPEQHVVCQYRPGSGEEWSSAKRTMCDLEWDALAADVSWDHGRWCQLCRDVLRAELTARGSGAY